MVAKLSQDSFEENVKKASAGSLKVLGSYVNTRTKIKIVCLVCKYNWMANPITVTYQGSGCPKCAVENHKQTCINAKHGKEKHIANLKKVHQDRVSLVGKYNGLKFEADYKCHTHKVLFSHIPEYVQKGMACPECARDKWRVAKKPAHTPKSYRLHVKKLTNNLREVLGDYVNMNTQIEHKCNECKYSWMVSPRSMLTHLGCGNCGYAKGRATGSKYRIFKLGKRNVKLQGGEPEALNFLLETTRLKPENVYVGSEGKVPGICYSFNGVDRLYRPDFLIHSLNRLIEVKSTWYFGLTNKIWYDQLVAKAKACVKQGYDFRVIISNLKNSSPLLLPKDWYTMTQREFQKFWKRTYSLSLNGCVL